jgi:Mrp family chromosome partitioning ATPase
MREKYDIVLFDSAPILEMTDGAILASETDATIIVIKADKTTRKALKIAVAQLEQVGVKILGVVLNNANVKRDKYYFNFRAKRKSVKIKPIKRRRRTITLK